METLYLIVAVYKVEKYLERCIESLLAQTYPKTRIVLIDDGSPDNCPTICDRYAQMYEHVMVLHKENGGLSDARNHGLAYCFSVCSDDDFIAYVDSDDFLHESLGERLINLCREHNCQIAQSECERGSADSFPDKSYPVKIEIADRKEALLGYRLKSQCNPKVYRVSIIKGLFFPINMWNEDEFYTYKAAYNCQRICFTNEKLLYYYQRADSIMDSVARKLKNNIHKNDWLRAYVERYLFFKSLGEEDLALRSLEKIGRDIILRYEEQMRLPKEARDLSAKNGEYIRTYRRFYRQFMGRRGIPFTQRLMYRIFYYIPYSAYMIGKVTALRK